jgi:hypothetical protein
MRLIGLFDEAVDETASRANVMAPKIVVESIFSTFQSTMTVFRATNLPTFSAGRR